MRLTFDDDDEECEEGEGKPFCLWTNRVRGWEAFEAIDGWWSPRLQAQMRDWLRKHSVRANRVPLTSIFERHENARKIVVVEYDWDEATDAPEVVNGLVTIRFKSVQLESRPLPFPPDIVAAATVTHLAPATPSVLDRLETGGANVGKTIDTRGL